MNYLAHAYLSLDYPGVVVGNMISDFVKGRKKYQYSEEIQTGIALHRAIDEFTDYYPANDKAKAFFRPVYRLYSAAFIDIVYDHFLANDKSVFPDDQYLSVFAANTYRILESFEPDLPGGFRLMFPYMKRHNWLYNYKHTEGIRRSFGGLVRRAKYIDEADQAFSIFENRYDELRSCYQEFFPALKDFATYNLQLIYRI
ncbi:MAG: ACP phosphodiesterase [Chitinophagaceae bacterium]